MIGSVGYTMKRRFGSLFALLLLSGVTVQAQIPIPKPCRIRIFVIDDRRQPVRDATVELQDASGYSEGGPGNKITMQDGRVDFDSFTGPHRVRVTGSEIVAYEGDFGVAPSEKDHTEYIRVTLKTPSGGDNPPPGPPIPTARLKIPGIAQKEYEKGNKAAEKNDWKAAAAAYQAAIQQYPDYDLAYNALGITLMSQGDQAGARNAFKKALSITPDYAMAARNLARLELAEHDWKHADELLRKSLQTEPVNAWALTNAAYAELQLRDFADAVVNAQKVHAIPHAEYASAHYIAAVALEQLGKPAEARAEYELYLKEEPSGPNATRAHDAVARLSHP